MKPIKVFVLLIIVQIILLGIVFLFPEGKLFSINALNFNYISRNELFTEKNEQISFKKDSISNSLENSKLDTSSLYTSDSVGLNISEDTSKLAFADSLKSHISFEEVKGLDSISYAIEYDSSKSYPLTKFFAGIDSLIKSGKKLSVFHYGDSQIEGDRISSTLREKLQRKFGGCGTGLIPVIELNNVRSSVTMDFEGEWVKSAIYGGLHKIHKSKEYGPLTSFYTYKIKESDSNDSKEYPSLGYEKSYSAYAHAKRFESFSIFTNENLEENDISLKNIDPLQIKSKAVNILGDGKIKEFKWVFKNPKSKVKVTLNPVPNAGIYASSLDCNNGISVHNVAMRGSSGVDFGKLNLPFYSQWMPIFNVKLIILEYGVNVVPFVTNNYSFYEKSFAHQIRLLKQANPDASIIVVGCSDVAIKEGTEYISSPNIGKIKTAQKNAAFKNGVAFWDLQSAMGGENAMPIWVNSNPSLAEKDYTHFNHRGARIVGEMLYNAIIKEYVEQKKIQKKNL